MPIAARTPESPPEPMPPRLEALFDDHSETVFQAAYRITGNAADAEDVLQTVFLRLVARGTDLDLAPSPASYLRRAAVNAALDLVRARGVRPAVTLELVPPEGLPSTERGAERAMEDRETRDRLRRALGKLHPRMAEMFVLRYLEGRGNVEIAATVGTSASVVAVTLFRARRQIRKLFGTERKSST